MMTGEENLYDLLKKRLSGFLTDRPISNVRDWVKDLLLDFVFWNIKTYAWFWLEIEDVECDSIDSQNLEFWGFWIFKKMGGWMDLSFFFWTRNCILFYYVLHSLFFILWNLLFENQNIFIIFSFFSVIILGLFFSLKCQKRNLDLKFWISFCKKNY